MSIIHNSKFIIRGRKGISLFEVVLAVGIAAIIVTVSLRFGTIIANLGNLIGGQVQTSQDAGLGFQVFVQEARSMAISVTGAYPIEAASTSSLTFYSDAGNDGVVDRIRYFFGTSTLQKGVVKASGTPLSYVTSTEVIKTAIPNVIVNESQFSYFDASYTGSQSPLTSPVDALAIRVVQMTMVVEVGSSTAPRAATFTQIVTPRNLRTD